jgi:ATP-binding cassette subfamily F protein 3
MARTVLHIGAGRLTPYAGDYEYYLDKSRATSERAALTAGEKLHNAQPPEAAVEKAASAPGMREAREQRRLEAEQRKAEAKVKRDHEKRIAELERQVLALEGRQAELTAELEKPETHEPGGAAMQLNRELLSVADELARVTAEWEAAAGA